MPARKMATVGKIGLLMLICYNFLAMIGVPWSPVWHLVLQATRARRVWLVRLVWHPLGLAA